MKTKLNVADQCFKGKRREAPMQRDERKLSAIRCIGTALLLTASLCVVDGFSTHTFSRRTNSPALRAFPSWLSGVTGVAPSSLLSDSLQSELTSGTSLDGVDLECAYKASRDGWSAIDFHRCSDNRGSGLVVALSRSGALFGGFNPLGWRSTDDYGGSNAAFLWCSQGRSARKFPILTGGTSVLMERCVVIYPVGLVVCSQTKESN